MSRRASAPFLCVALSASMAGGCVNAIGSATYYRVTGRIIDQETRRPIQGAAVIVCPGRILQNDLHGGVRRAQSDNAGAFCYTCGSGTRDRAYLFGFLPVYDERESVDVSELWVYIRIRGKWAVKVFEMDGLVTREEEKDVLEVELGDVEVEQGDDACSGRQDVVNALSGRIGS